MRDQEIPGHNRWHPDIPPAASVRPDDEFRVECRDWTDCQIGDNDSADDVRDADLSVCHMLSGPIRIEGAEPGDLLIVDVLDLGPLPGHGEAAGEGWGYTGVFAKSNGGSFLTDYYPDALKAVWDFHGQQATSRHLPGVRYTGVAHPGLFGTAPSAELLERWNRRERALIATDPDRVPPLALPPDPHGALTGLAPAGDAERIAREGARTVPPREHGGNQDIKNFSRGSRVFVPVFVDGANLSVGDLHFSQGDGEITFCGAIEMGGFIDFHVDLIKGGMEKYGVTTNPVFMPGNVEPRYSEFISFVGISVDPDDDTNLYLDATTAYKRACLNGIEYLKKFGYTGEQAYLLLGSAPIEGRISGIVDIPNACCTLYLPTAIFDFDVRPTADGPRTADRRQCAVTS
ncbi:formamidase [Actinomadura rubrobrunea]|uniref:Formamidase n=2 Tax=Actinomadura rubrobrunea TaxID=115335 RepID=A0A9W6UZ38_9ACTN|nr:formamidase [Actinomadura rubrobrunea]